MTIWPGHVVRTVGETTYSAVAIQKFSFVLHKTSRPKACLAIGVVKVIYGAVPLSQFRFHAGLDTHLHIPTCGLDVLGHIAYPIDHHLRGNGSLQVHFGEQYVLKAWMTISNEGSNQLTSKRTACPVRVPRGYIVRL